MLYNNFSFEQLKQEKKLLIPGGIVILFFLLMIVFIVISGKKNSQSLSHAMPTISVQPTATNIVSPSEKPNQWQTYTNSYFSIQYPSSARISELPIASGGIAFTAINSQDKKEFFPRVHVEVTSTAKAISIGEIIKKLAPYQLLQSKGIFQGIETTQLQGTLPMTFPSGNPPKEKHVQKIFYFFQYKDLTYVLDYAFYEDENIQSSKDLMAKILATFSFR